LPAEAILVAMSGIDGSGKSHAAARMAQALRHRGHEVASLSVDGWLHLPSVRFSKVDPAEHFYRHAIRFEAMFAELLLPLRRDRRIRLEADYSEEQAAQEIHFRIDRPRESADRVLWNDPRLSRG
jgi:uridine kinase